LVRVILEYLEVQYYRLLQGYPECLAVQLHQVILEYPVDLLHPSHLAIPEVQSLPVILEFLGDQCYL
jgi:hypothetical protein